MGKPEIAQLKDLKAKLIANTPPGTSLNLAIDSHAGTSNGGTPLALLRFFFDAIYIILFFAVMSSAAYGVDLIIAQWEQRHIDPVVLIILRGVSYVLVILDAIGVVVATGLLTLRFIRSFWRSFWRADD